uniref:DUF1618 domain-containing protein n=1 Tax=Oryza glumipatula TaxID=40148 RepID=A0A0D9ZW77_9ORYZ
MGRLTAMSSQCSARTATVGPSTCGGSSCKPSPLPLPWQINMYIEAVEFAGQLWWLDLTWDIVSADPFNDRLELDFVELPRNSVCLEPSTNIIQEQGMHRRLVVSEGRLRYIEFSFALDDDGSSWTLEHQVVLGRICEVKG